MKAAVYTDVLVLIYQVMTLLELLLLLLNPACTTKFYYINTHTPPFVSLLFMLTRYFNMHIQSVAASLNSNMSTCTDSYLVYVPMEAGVPLYYEEELSRLM
jgi:hypothetical protein